MPGDDLRHKSLTELEAACHWYSVALGQHSVQEFGTDFHTEFSEFLLRRKRWSTCRGWASAIRQHANSPAQAWELFFRLLDQYRASREEKHP